MTNLTKSYEPLTSENAALVLVDHQVGLMTGVRDYSTGELKHNVVALAKAAKALNLPIVVTTTARDSMWGRANFKREAGKDQLLATGRDNGTSHGRRNDVDENRTKNI